MNSVLIVDDDEELCELVVEYLKCEGMDVDTVHIGEEGVKQALAGEYAVVVLDVMLPGINGFEVLRRIRAAAGKAAQLPVLMLTARGDELDRVLGLELGADDYLSKPFSSRELAARLRAILRRTASHYEETELPGAGTVPAHDVLRVGDLELDNGGHRVTRGNETLDLTGVEFKLLELMLRRAGDVVTREEMAQSVLGRSLLPYDRSLDTHLSNLRRKLGLNTDGGERIKTIRSIGYIYARPSRD